jgi:UDP-N-acetylmuramyl pentapeptide phosphotransferase/UDP-N-acetylglucosamine-1-phosphate transferase
MERSLIVLAGVPAVAAALTVLVIAWSLPWLRSHTMALPGERSSHRAPTPQGGGLAVILATFVTAWCAASLSGPLTAGELWQFSALTAAAALLTVLGFVDDLRNVSQVVRLLAQCAAAGMVIATLPEGLRIATAAPLWLERLLILIAGVWFINLVNFMDGIDWITVAEVVPITGALAVLGLIDTLPRIEMLLALALLGSMLGFAPFNKPVARLFLGDVGSLPIGLLLGWLLLAIAVRGNIAAALLLPLYYLADTTIVLIRRLVRGEPFWQAHRTHFYQQAIDNGFTALEVVARVFAVNVVLAALAFASILGGSLAVSVAALAAGAIVVGMLLWRFARGRT